MTRMQLVPAALAIGIVLAGIGPAAASERPPTLQSVPKAKLGTRVVVTGLFFRERKPATLYLEAGTTRRQLATANVRIGGQVSFKLLLPAKAPSNAHLLVCQNRCSSRVRLALTH
jgi:hypothetical protein